MLERITINLSTQERIALERIASEEMRNTREQARFIIRQELERRGLLQPTQQASNEPEVENA